MNGTEFWIGFVWGMFAASVVAAFAVHVLRRRYRARLREAHEHAAAIRTMRATKLFQ